MFAEAKPESRSSSWGGGERSGRAELTCLSCLSGMPEGDWHCRVERAGSQALRVLCGPAAAPRPSSPGSKHARGAGGRRTRKILLLGPGQLHPPGVAAEFAVSPARAAGAEKPRPQSPQPLIPARPAATAQLDPKNSTGRVEKDRGTLWAHPLSHTVHLLNGWGVVTLSSLCR